MTIQRRLTNERTSQIAARSGTVYLTGQVGDKTNVEIKQRTHEMKNIEHLLPSLTSTNESCILPVTIYLTEIETECAGIKSGRDEQPPKSVQPACVTVEAELSGPKILGELSSIAAPP